MATTQEAIARLRMIFETQGADAAVAEMKKLETAETSLGTSSLNLDRAFTGLERRYSETARATADYERSMRTLNAAVAQNPALAERAAAVQQTIAARYQTTMQAARQATQAQTAYGQVSQAVGAQAQALAASTGLLGSTLSTLGGAGTVAAVGLGALYLAYQKLDEGVTRTAQYARDISHFAEATGLTTSQVQGLNKEATRFGISSEELHAGLQRFTAGFEEVRSGGGAMLEIIRKIDPELARQAVTAGNETEALSVVGEALRRASNEFDRARLARAAFGRGGSDIALMVKDLDLGAVTERYKDRGLSQEVIEDLKRLQSEVDARGASISNKIYGYFGVPWLEAKNHVLAYIEAVLKIGSAADAGKAKSGGALVGEALKVLGSASPLLGSMATIGLGIAGSMTKVDEETKKAVTDQQRLADAFKQTEAAGKRAAPNPQGQVRSEMSEVATGTYDRQLEALKAMKAEYPGLVAQDAARMVAMDDQLRAAQAVTGVQKMQAQEETMYNQLVRQGVEPELAMAMAKKQSAIAQAQVNAQAQQQLLNLKNQAGVAAAVTGADRMRAQQIATINSLLQQGVDLETAQKIAAQERANAEAAVSAAVEKQVTSLNESTELIKAQIADMQEQSGEAQKILGIHEMMVRTQQAYNQAIREGASEEAASALAAATYNNLLAQRAMQIQQIAIAQAQQAQQQAAAAEAAGNAAATQAGQAFNQKMASAQTSAQVDAYQQMKSLADAGSNIAKNYMREILDSGYGAAALFNSQSMMPTIQAAQQEVARLPQIQQHKQAQASALDQLKSLQDEGRLGAAATPQEKAQIQAQITYENLLKEGVSATVAQQVANQQLANTMQELAKSVDANTTALQDQLDPIYTEGRAALRIGYYGEGSGGTARNVTGTGYATPANMNEPSVPRAGAPVAGTTVVINNNFPPGSVLGDRRTQYLAANSYGRAIKAAG
jgi:hypothetical protein